MFKTLKIYLGERVDYKSLVKSFSELGYRRVSSLGARDEFSLKGSSISIYPSSYELPLRIEVDDDLISSIRVFNPHSGDILEEHRMLILLPVKLSKLKDKESIYLESTPIESFLDIKKGDYVVHINHGVGRFLGIKTLKGEDFFLIKYFGEDRLYISIKDADLIQRYLGFGGRAPKLSKLGSKDWQSLKSKAKCGIESFAKDLLKIQAERTSLKGYSFSRDTDWQNDLKSSFPYRETSDQLKAIEEVKRDMESTYAMDRLICGDVGYGKTEVALRAAFKAVMDNKQVSMLVPTTILAQQHYQRFLERLAQFPVRVDMLSRFRTGKEQKGILADLKEGKIDIIIGTHGLISSSVEFKDLGLLIIDEEQRFGVIQKERFKQYRQVVDVLTLTATPIPRTLYMSLVGIKGMSVINTPPEERLPVKTYISEYDDNLIKRVIRRELKRGGQVFFVNNRIRGIERMAAKLKRLLPKAEIAVAHGRMEERDLADIMARFLNSEIDVLVSTTIIQSGIDIPNVNTLIINRADMFGLAGLYQLKGRVGRYNRIAYAYFLIPKGKPVSDDASRRLKTIIEESDLGAGFKIAIRDLEIRGAGNILGQEQHGFIQSVGFDLYCRLLKQTIYKLTGDEIKEKIFNKINN
ncbi:MAG: transcription-repair coupling factor [Candidatus Kaelpia aquatica]|nr:transcription-repair coupling factor [Candidatus Kaelpia aquatica]